MAVVKCAKIETTQVAGGAGDQYGFTISVHSATEEFNFLGNIDIDTNDGIMSAGDIAIVEDFIALVTARLLAS
jgi:hypothetical protein